MATGTQNYYPLVAPKLSFTAKLLHGAVCFTSSQLGQVTYKI